MEYVFNNDNFETEVLKSDIPVLVDFYADWCGPCKMMAPIVHQLADAYEGQMKIGKLNVDNTLDIAQKYRVMSIPTFIFFSPLNFIAPKSYIMSRYSFLVLV